MVMKPVAVWIEKERLDDRIVKCLTVILRSRGCYWNRCLMCGYKKDTSKDVTLNDLIEQLKFALRKMNGAEVVKIFTSGSFLDSNEIPREFRSFVYNSLAGKVKKLIIESRPEFVNKETVEELSSLDFETEVGIGLETADDFIREHCINKGFKFEDFKRAARLLKSYGVRVKAYLLLKPPFLSEGEAIRDVIRSIKAVKDLVDVVSVNPVNVQSNTYVERLWLKRLYRPPWLWSAVEVLKDTDVETICDPVAYGKSRGPHNCGRCDREVAKAIRDFSLTQNPSVFDGLSCSCIKLWEKIVELEDHSRIPLALISV